MTTYNFETKTYNGISIIINEDDGYINASQMCSSNDKQWRHYKNTKTWLNVKNAFERRFCQGGIIRPPTYYLEKVEPKWQGEYIHPKLVHFVAEYCSIDYAFAVAELMDSINDKVHDVLNDKQLADIPENAKPIFNEVVKSIIPDIKYNDSCWGYRDNVHALDQNEREDLRRCIDEYKDVKERLTKAENQINEWGSRILKIFSGF